LTGRTLVIIRPDSNQRHPAGEVIGRFEKKGFKLVAGKLVKISKEQARQLYDVHRGKPFFGEWVKFISSGPVLLMVWEAEGIIAMSRRMTGATFGFDAEADTIRGTSIVRTCTISFTARIAPSRLRWKPIFFQPDEVVNYKLTEANRLYDGKKRLAKTAATYQKLC
jgi:nucleoside-diphosphate kinase